MNHRSSPTCRPLPIMAGVMMVLLAVTPGLADSTRVQPRSKTLSKSLAIYYDAPRSVRTDPGLLVVPLLSPAKQLLPGGKLLIWVGLSDGTPLPDQAVRVSIPASDTSGNALVLDGQRKREAFPVSDADGLIEIFLAAPNVPRSPSDQEPPEEEPPPPEYEPMPT